MCWSGILFEIPFKATQEHIVLYKEKQFFRIVFKSWQLASETKLPDTNSEPSSRFPALLLPEKIGDDEFRELFFLSNKKTRNIRLPEAYGKWCLSSKGLLATVGDDYAVKLINPLSHETINLPSITTLPVFWEEPLEELWDRFINKLLVSSTIPTLGIVVVLWGDSMLAYCRPGDNEWIPVVTGWRGGISDITYYNNQVYSFDCHYYIRACDIYGDNPKLMVIVSKLPQDLYDGDDFGAFIIGCDDDDGRRRLLVIIKETTWRDNVTLMTESFQVFAYDLKTKTWSKVKDLGRKTLFVGQHSSTFWIQDTSGVTKENCIYYTDHSPGCWRDMGIYHMSDGTIEPHYDYDVETICTLTPPIWLQTI